MIAAFSELLKNLSFLDYLSIIACKKNLLITDILNAVPYKSFENLTTLKLKECLITDENIETLKIDEKLPILKHFSLSHNLLKGETLNFLTTITNL